MNAATVTIRFIKRHAWGNARAFNVYHTDDVCLSTYPNLVNAVPIRLWDSLGEPAGFGRGRFGVGAFGWAQGESADGGFGRGRFGLGDFGYYNPVAEWTSRQRFSEGVHTFGVRLVGTHGVAGALVAERCLLIRPRPAAPRAFTLTEMTANHAVVRWTPSEDLR